MQRGPKVSAPPLQPTRSLQWYRTESRSDYRRIAGHRRRIGQGLSRPQLPRGRHRPLDQAFERRRRSRRCRRHRRPQDRRTHNRRSCGPVRPHRPLVNNAGIFIAEPFTEYTVEDFAAVLSVNLDGFFRVTQRAIAEMEETGQRPSRADLHQPGRPGHSRRAFRAGVADQRRPGRRDQIARDRYANAASARTQSRSASSRRRHPRDARAARRAAPVGHMGETWTRGRDSLPRSAGFVTGEILHVDGGHSAGH